MKTISLLLLLLSVSPLVAQNQLPVISNVNVNRSPSGDVMILTYDLVDAENDPVDVYFRATAYGEQSFDYETQNATGDVGPGILPGAGKQILWDFSAYASAQPQFRLMLVADDGQPVDIQQIVDQADSVRMKMDMDLLEGIRHRSTGVALLQDTKEYIQSQFQAADLETYLQEFLYGNYPAANVIGRKAGMAEENDVFILDGHFDSVNNSPGADDNASAVVGMLEALRLLSPYSFRKSIKFMGFDLEEAGLIGSTRYVQDGILPNEDIKGVLNLEMIGYYTEVPNSQTLPYGFDLLYPGIYATLQSNQFRGDFINNIGDGGSVSLMNAFVEAAESYVPGLSVISVEAPDAWQFLAPDLGRSDHAPFWLAGIPALMLTDGSEFRNQYYHTPDDTSDKLNFTFMRQVTQAAVATLAEEAQIRHATTWWRDVDFVTSVDEFESCSFEVFPNPADDILRLSWGDCFTGDMEILLFNTKGQSVRNHTYRLGQPARQLIDIRGLDGGVYFLHVKKEGSSVTKRIVVE